MKPIFVSCLLCFFLCTANSQCFPDRHNTSWNSAWISCDRTVNPNSIRGNSHWIRLDLNNTYSLGQMTLWNYNDPENLDRGIQEFVLDYSLDGVTWEEWGTFTLDRAEGSGFYEGVNGPNLGGLNAKELIITGLSNYGGTCYALSEMKVEVLEFISNVNELEEFDLSISPNPATEYLNLEVNVENIEGDLKYTIVDLKGRRMINGSIPANGDRLTHKINIQDLNPGQYFLELGNAKASSAKAFIKINR